MMKKQNMSGNPENFSESTLASLIRFYDYVASERCRDGLGTRKVGTGGQVPWFRSECWFGQDEFAPVSGWQWLVPGGF